MRDALKDSLDQDPGFVGYRTGSIVLCASCARPLYQLSGPIGVGARAGRMVDRFEPLTLAALMEIVGRDDVPPATQRELLQQTLADQRIYLDRILRPRPGDAMLCPFCGHAFASARSAERSDTLDRAYVIELTVLPPLARRRWTH